MMGWRGECVRNASGDLDSVGCWRVAAILNRKGADGSFTPGDHLRNALDWNRRRADKVSSLIEASSVMPLHMMMRYGSYPCFLRRAEIIASPAQHKERGSNRDAFHKGISWLACR